MRIPLFPLDVVLFPGAPLPLHIFEQRYREMIGRCISDGVAFGVALIREGNEVGGSAETETVGTTAEISEHRRLPDGRYVLIATGCDRFRIVERLVDDPFPQAEVEIFAPDRGEGVSGAEVEEVATMARRYRLLAAEAGEVEPVEVAPVWGEAGGSPETRSFECAALVEADSAFRQRLLELDTAGRIGELRGFFEAEIPRLRAAVVSR